MADRPWRIGLLTTGGTIASVAEEDGGALRPEFGPSELLELIPGLGEDDVEVRELALVSGWDLTPETVLAVARAARELLDDEQIAGIVVTHGTDTIEETAFACDLLVPSERPIVFTGAMRALSEPGTDAPRNLRSAFRCAVAPELSGYGAVVVMRGEVHAARWVRKADSRQMAALLSPGRGPIGVSDEGAVRVERERLPRVVFPIPDQLPAVPVISLYPGTQEGTISAIVELTRARAIVLEGSGAGNLPASVVPEVQVTLEAGVTIAVVSRVLAGGTQPVYGGPGGGASLNSMGVLQAGGLPAGKARLLLGILLGLSLSGPDLRRAFASAVGRLK